MAPLRSPASSTPPTAAIAEDSAKTCSFVTVVFMPIIVQATWLSRSADNRRPKRPRRRASRPTAHSERGGQQHEVGAVALEGDPSTSRRSTRTDPRSLNTSLRMKNTLSMNTANARVARRGRALGAERGSATSAPTGTAHRGNGGEQPEQGAVGATLVMAKAPMPAKVIWHSDTWPAQPVKGTMERAMRPRASPGATSVSVASEATAANAQAPPMSAAPATTVLRSRRGAACGRRRSIRRAAGPRGAAGGR